MFFQKDDGIMNRLKKVISVLIVLVLAVSFLASCSKDEDAPQGNPGESRFTLPAKGIGRYDSDNGQSTGESESDTEPPVVPIEREGTIICVDPGHGFVDGGCGEGYLGDYVERDITMQVATRLRDYLVSMGFEVIMTHDGMNIPEWDVDKNNIFSAAERAVYVNTLDIDYLVSVHVNSFDESYVSGMQIYYEQNGNKPNNWSEGVAYSIQQAIFDGQVETSNVTMKNDYSLIMTRETRVAASLIEIGYCTNPVDAANMLDAEWQDKLAKSIAMGIYNFFSTMD